MPASASRKAAPEPETVTIEVRRKELAAALASILPANEKRNTVPVLGGILVTVETGCIRMQATNLDQWLAASVPATANRPTMFVLCDPHGLAALLKLIELNTIAIEIHTRGGLPIVVLTAGAVEAEFYTMAWEDFPVFTRPPSCARDLHFNGHDLAVAIDRVSYAISTEETRYYLNGIYLHARDGEPWVVATDGHRLALARIESELGANDDGTADYGVIIPRPAVAMIKDMAARGAVNIRLWQQWLEIEQDGFILQSRLIDGTFPDYQRVIPTNNEQHAVLPPLLVTPALKRVGTLCHAKTIVVRVTIEPATITLMMRDPEGGKVTETVDLPEVATQRFEHGVNGKYLAATLDSFGGQVVRYRWADPASPIVFYSADAESQASASHVAVLMPMRV